MEVSVKSGQYSKAVKKRPAFLSEDFTENKVQLVRGGRRYFDLLKSMIRRAQETIHLQTYIYDDDETGQEIAGELIKAAKRNVKVFLLVDGFASQSMSQSFINYLREGGVNFRFFEPILRSKYFYFGRRLHHKMMVVDTQCAVVGGINISNRYNDWNGIRAWLDFALYVEGKVAKELCVLAYKTWKGFPQKMGLTPCEQTKTYYNIDPDETSFVRMRRNDWVRRKKQVSASYIELLKEARHEITILCSYFLPPHEFLYHLLRAARRGVKIKVIVAGRSDVQIAKRAERFIYEGLLKNNIEIYEYQKTILHGKLAVCDNKWFVIGSYNVNKISAYASIELNLDVYDPVVAEQTNKMLQNIIEEDCIPITSEWLEKRKNIFQRFIEWTSYQIVRALFYLFTFYFKQHA
jgi:cardiolipin synthase A/B